MRDPRTGQIPYAVVQLRQENLRADSYNLVGFQNHLKFGEQARILRLIPGLENAKFLRYGQIHRNTYINSPTLLRETLQMKQHPNVLFAGTDLRRRRLRRIHRDGIARRDASLRTGIRRRTGPSSTRHSVRRAGELHLPRRGENFQPANITFDLLLPLDEATRRRVRDKKQRHEMVCERALAELEGWLDAQPAAVESIHTPSLN